MHKTPPNYAGFSSLDTLCRYTTHLQVVRFMDTLFLKYAGSPSALTERFRQATAALSPKTSVRVLAPGESLVLEAA
jgi:hypothetical protein